MWGGKMSLIEGLAALESGLHWQRKYLQLEATPSFVVLEAKKLLELGEFFF